MRSAPMALFSFTAAAVSRFSRVRLLATPWTAAHQAPPSMGFARQEYWSGLPLPSSFTREAQLVNKCSSLSKIKV